MSALAISGRTSSAAGPAGAVRRRCSDELDRRLDPGRGSLRAMALVGDALVVLGRLVEDGAGAGASTRAATTMPSAGSRTSDLRLPTGSSTASGMTSPSTTAGAPALLATPQPASSGDGTQPTERRRTAAGRGLTGRADCGEPVHGVPVPAAATRTAPGHGSSRTASIRSLAQPGPPSPRSGSPPTRAVVGRGTRMVATAGLTRLPG